jgi:hypothetical protein
MQKVFLEADPDPYIGLIVRLFQKRKVFLFLFYYLFYYFLFYIFIFIYIFFIFNFVT